MDAYIGASYSYLTRKKLLGLLVICCPHLYQEHRIYWVKGDTSLSILEELHILSDEELKDICTSRGFELVREEPQEGVEPRVYTHEDYVDAALQCLQIEEEIALEIASTTNSTILLKQHVNWMYVFHDFARRNQVIQDNPEIIEQLQAEADRMQQEQERLIAQKRKLEEELEKASTPQEKAGSSVFGVKEGDQSNTEVISNEAPRKGGTGIGTQLTNESDTFKDDNGRTSDNPRPTIGDQDYELEPNMSVGTLMYEVGRQIKKDICTILAPFHKTWQHPLTIQIRRKFNKSVVYFLGHPAVQSLISKTKGAIKPILLHPMLIKIRNTLANGAIQSFMEAVQVTRKYFAALFYNAPIAESGEKASLRT